MISVLIVGGIRLYREGLNLLLCRRSDLQVVGTAAGPVDALAQLSTTVADIMLVDLATDGAVQLIGDARRTAATTAVIALGLTESEQDVMACIEAGVAGFVTREASLDELAEVIGTASRGELLCTPRLAGTLMRRVAALASSHATHPGQERLTSRERQIVGLIEQNLTNKEIATRLGIEVVTVKNHVHNLLEKLNVQRRSDVALGSLARQRAQPVVHPRN